MNNKYSTEIKKMRRKNNLTDFIRKVFERLDDNEFKKSFNNWLNQQSANFQYLVNQTVGYIYLEKIGIKVNRSYSMETIVDIDDGICYNCAASFDKTLRKIECTGVKLR